MDKQARMMKIGREDLKTDDNIERVEALMKKNRRLTVAEIVLEIDVSFGSTYSIIYSKLYNNVQ